MLLWYIFFNTFKVNLPISLKSECIVNSIVELFFLIYCANICPLIGVFRPFTFKVVIDMLGLKSFI